MSKQTVRETNKQSCEAVSVDERLVASKNHYSGIRQFIRDKPMRFGLKLLVLADPSLVMHINFLVYLEKKWTELCDKSEGLKYNVVM